MFKSRVYIIAEIGVNHNGSLDLAKKLIDRGVDAGVDAVKFQTFKAENLVSKSAPKAEYQLKTTEISESQLEMIKRLEFSFEEYSELQRYCKERKIDFLSSPFDLESADFLLNTMKLDVMKIPSGEITNLPLLEYIAERPCKVILSTGMSTMDEIAEALDIFTSHGKKCEEIAVLHCNTEYPTPMNDVNLYALSTIGNKFGTIIGYSDHTPGIEVPLAAVALGAKIIEKHYTLDKEMEGPDHKASLNPDELKQMVISIRNIEKALGSAEKKPSPSELKNLNIARKSIVAKQQIKKGELLTEKNITTKRPGNGISPMRWYEYLNTPAKRDYSLDELID